MARVTLNDEELDYILGAIDRLLDDIGMDEMEHIKPLEELQKKLNKELVK